MATPLKEKLKSCLDSLAYLNGNEGIKEFKKPRYSIFTSQELYSFLQRLSAEHPEMIEDPASEPLRDLYWHTVMLEENLTDRPTTKPSSRK